MSLKNNVLLIIVLIIAIVLFLAIQKQTKVCFDSQCFKVEIAQTQEKLTKGLMLRKSLDPDKGMLFIFEIEHEHSFWMKDTFIPLDIIWINMNKEVVHIERNVQPCAEECEIIVPDAKAKYVLEINPGILDVQLGDRVIFNNI